MIRRLAHCLDAFSWFFNDSKTVFDQLWNKMRNLFEFFHFVIFYRYFLRSHSVTFRGYGKLLNLKGGHKFL